MTEADIINEQRENRLAANMSLIFGALAIIVYLINRLGIFYIEREQFAVVFAIWFVALVILQIFGRVPLLAGSSYSKFVIVSLVFVLTLSGMTVLNFHAIPLLCFPMIIAYNYHSEKVAHISFALTLVCAVLWPLLGVFFRTWDVAYFLFLIGLIDNNLIVGTELEKYIIVDNLGIGGALLFLSLPQVGFATVFGIIIRITNNYSRKNYDNKIKDLKDSRDKILAGMADIIENRDMSTGDHIKRTSEVIKILVRSLPLDENGHQLVDDEYADYLVRSAPLHDLGKVAIPDAILTKRGRLTPTEFEYIKIHPKKSCELIESVLAGLNNEKLTKIAKNIALYHHEKYDGSGYPEGLMGDSIPFEARVMAIADVYDALVSERCYKESVSHEQAYWIIKDSMGTHFDPQLWSCFDKAYSDIVAYYKSE